MCAFSRQNVAEWPNSCHFQGESYVILWKSFELILVCFLSLLILGINPIKLSHHWCYPFTFCSSLWGCLWNPRVSDGWRLLNGTFLGTVYYTVQGDSNFLVCGWNHVVWPFKWNLFASIWTWWYLFFSILQNEIWKFLSNFDYGQFLAIIGLRQQVALFKERRQLLN